MSRPAPGTTSAHGDRDPSLSLCVGSKDGSATASRLHIAPPSALSLDGARSRPATHHRA